MFKNLGYDVVEDRVKNIDTLIKSENLTETGRTSILKSCKIPVKFYNKQLNNTQESIIQRQKSDIPVDTCYFIANKDNRWLYGAVKNPFADLVDIETTINDIKESLSFTSLEIDAIDLDTGYSRVLLIPNTTLSTTNSMYTYGLQVDIPILNAKDIKIQLAVVDTVKYLYVLTGDLKKIKLGKNFNIDSFSSSIESYLDELEKTPVFNKFNLDNGLDYTDMLIDDYLTLARRSKVVSRKQVKELADIFAIINSKKPHDLGTLYPKELSTAKDALDILILYLDTNCSNILQRIKKKKELYKVYQQFLFKFLGNSITETPKVVLPSNYF